MIQGKENAQKLLEIRKKQLDVSGIAFGWRAYPIGGMMEMGAHQREEWRQGHEDEIWIYR